MSMNSINFSEFFILRESSKFIKQEDELEGGHAMSAYDKFAFVLSALSEYYKK